MKGNSPESKAGDGRFTALDNCLTAMWTLEEDHLLDEVGLNHEASLG